MSELATTLEPSTGLSSVFSPQLEQALKGADQELSQPESSFVRIAVGAEFPLISWGRDFEVRVPLESKTGFSTRKLEAALPVRFRGQREWWGSYIGQLSRSFCEAFGALGCQVRFSQTSTDLCKLFHADNVQVRLIQTFQGPGTEYLLSDNVDRSGLGQGSNERIVLDPAKVQRVPEKEILLMRGERWFAGRSLVHRSPPIEESGLKRLYLCLDPLLDF